MQNTENTPPNPDTALDEALCAVETAEASLEGKVAELEAQIAEMKDQFLRARAEAENIRRRAADDVAAAHKFAIAKFAQELLPVKDCLEMALKDESGNFEAMKMGVDMTLKQLVGAFDKSQLVEIAPAVGDKLDPHQHQAMSAIDAPGAEPNTVVQVMQKGYQLADRVLRPAMVVVSKAA